MYLYALIGMHACVHLLLLQSALEVAVNSGNSSALVDLLNVLHLKRYSTCIAHTYISVYSIHVCIVLLILVHVYTLYTVYTVHVVCHCTYTCICTCTFTQYMYMQFHEALCYNNIMFMFKYTCICTNKFRTLWTLELSLLVLPELHSLITSRHASYVKCCCKVLKLILKSFGPLIKSNLATPPSHAGVDITKEERYKCTYIIHAHMCVI